MISRVPLINSRQKELLRTLLFVNKPISYNELAETFKLSKRTIQRELAALKSFLSYYQLKIRKKKGIGIELVGQEAGIQQLKEELGQAQALKIFSSEERQKGMTYSLLMSKEPIKLFTFSQTYGVSEATISSDLDKVERWLNEGNVKLHRTPGVGVYIVATEKQRRAVLSRLLHKDITFEEWMELFQASSNKNEGVNKQIEMDIRNSIFKFVDTSNLLIIEQTVRHVLKQQNEIELTDRNYVNLIVHIILAIERMKHGADVKQPSVDESQYFDQYVYRLAKKIVHSLEEALGIEIPLAEVYYIALHLEGARICKETNSTSDQTEFEWIEVVQTYIGAVSIYLGESLEGDEKLFEGLVSHFIPAFNRMKLQLQIHNPMLEKIKAKYPDVFQACKMAATILTDQLEVEVPDDEIGYIAMHIGASLIRKKDILQQSFKTVIVCASGLGTSTYLTSRLQKEIPNLSVEAIISVSELEQWVKTNAPVDVFISTVSISSTGLEHCVTVSPFLTKDDIKTIQTELLKVKTKQSPQRIDKIESSSSSMMSLAKYGEGMVQILRNLYLFEGVKNTSLAIRNLLSLIGSKRAISNIEKLADDLEKREKLGSFVIDDLAMLHTKTEGVNELFVAVFRMENYVSWKRDDNKTVEVQTFLLLAAPLTAPKEHIEMISEISASLIESDFIETLRNSPYDSLKSAIEKRLASVYGMKAKSTLKG